jgi:polysaccharide lyase family 4-like protein
MKKVGVFMAVAVGAIALLAVPMTSWAGGTVEGKVSFSGKPPAPKEFLFSKFPNPKFCVKNPNKDAKGEKRLLHEVQVGKDGGLKNAVVAVTGINDEKFQAEFKGEDIIAKLCEFLPYTGAVVPNQSSFRVMNTDADPDDPKSVKGVLHNPHSFEVTGPSSTTIFNIGLPEKDKGLDKPIRLRKVDKGSVFKLICDQHEFMQFWALPITSPYFAVVGEDGKFEIKDVPAGKYKMVAWHPALNKSKPIEQEIEVKDGASASAKFEFTK